MLVVYRRNHHGIAPLAVTNTPAHAEPPYCLVFGLGEAAEVRVAVGIHPERVAPPTIVGSAREKRELSCNWYTNENVKSH
ncbi:hypothetical protein BaRGS_00015945 [Batillaria attramentaria]|uniref:Uncharacterized protein n=1 Tax=Batillaria attramentaria TaxID=370345 RepID=A0ABD0L185_9CAEN